MTPGATSYRADPSHVTEALVLRVVEFGEADLIVHLLCPEQGRVSAIAKHARRSVKRFPGSLDLFNHLSVRLRPRPKGGMPLLERARLQCAFLPLRTHPGRYALACYLVELLGRLAPEGGAGPEMPAIFEFALSALSALSGAVPDRRMRVLLELRTLEALGLRPELRRCVRCAKEALGPGEIRFHVSDGGPVCAACVGPDDALLRVHLGTLRALERSLQLPLVELPRLRLPPQALAEAGQLVRLFERYHVGLELRSERFLSECL